MLCTMCMTCIINDVSTLQKLDSVRRGMRVKCDR